ncbi:MAG TPA: lipoprotein signal peptidase [Chitinophagales bacterium]|nr:lipoprotein signal peptidase [Chitinophagales bacterium]
MKTNFTLGGGLDILGLSWAKIHFVENEGMAFGLELGGTYGKLLLTLFRLLAVGGIGYYLYTLIRDKANFGLIISIALVCAGAMGNIFDSVFYGIYFSESTFTQVAEFMPAGGGYTTVLHGHVVDMLYFPIADGHWPEWMPFIGGKYYHFFRPVFNIADSAITIGVLSILIFQRRIFASPEMEPAKEQPVVAEETAREE